MSGIGQLERATQKRVIALFHQELGYDYLGDWSDRAGNSNIDEELLSSYLSRSGYTPAQITKAMYELRTEATNHNRTLYGNNQAVYHLTPLSSLKPAAQSEFVRHPLLQRYRISESLFVVIVPQNDRRNHQSVRTRKIAVRQLGIVIRARSSSVDFGCASERRAGSDLDRRTQTKKHGG